MNDEDGAMRSPFHEGERRAQDRAGERRMADGNAAMVSGRIAEGMLAFLRQQSMAVIGCEDAEGALWCFLVFGKAGFMNSDGAVLEIEMAAEEPLWGNLAARPRVGVLVIELATRRRMRVNGVAALFAHGLRVTVSEVFPNCAKYITRRQIRVASGGGSLEVKSGRHLDDRQMAAVRRADVFFVTTAHAERGLDTSHRGGRAGFVEVMGEALLRIPDYSGNSMFNTLGNLLLDARAGLAFPDFEKGTLLQFTGRAAVEWEQEDPGDLTGGTKRFWTFGIQQWRETALPDGVRSQFLEYSAFDPPVNDR